MAAQDILLDDDWDLLMKNGDLVIGNSDQQHIALVVETGPGHWKENPFLGFNSGLYLGSTISKPEFKVNLSEQLKSDNAVLNDVNINDNKEITNLDAERLIN